MAVVDIETLPKAGPERDREVCRVLEEGNILLFPKTPFELPEKDREFLLRQRQTEAGYHKNIAYRPGGDRVTGVARQQAEDARELRRVLRDFSRTAVDFASRLLAPYAGQWHLDYANFQPQEGAGRKALASRAQRPAAWIPSPPGHPWRPDLPPLYQHQSRGPSSHGAREVFPELAERRQYLGTSFACQPPWNPALGSEGAPVRGLPVRARPLRRVHAPFPQFR
jgi:hypothetical protein